MRTERLRVPAGIVRLRPLRRADHPAWRAARAADEAGLRAVEPEARGSWAARHTRRAFRGHLTASRAGVGAGAPPGGAAAAAIELDGRFAGQLTLADWRPLPEAECRVGYWVAPAARGGGVATAALALAADHAHAVGAHRLSATVLPDNAASRTVLARCGFRREGLLRASLRVDGRWRDHLLVARLAPGPGEPGAVQAILAAGWAEPVAGDHGGPDDSVVYGLGPG
ncbi:GNAT family N-acetyltransferase [Corynebacterium sphenisci]|uniref:GNAT family N-acetyltransferase n=1 Tax=Corynebacterium sphenisci TaxID=191493 RepID=UPI0026E00D6B|nr:GNAT family protein [Corynebacterium sphenisci]MDO5731106.1 GNAT family protein [Corynebacterium sphenisci]